MIIKSPSLQSNNKSLDNITNYKENTKKLLLYIAVVILK